MGILACVGVILPFPFYYYLWNYPQSWVNLCGRGRDPCKAMALVSHFIKIVQVYQLLGEAGTYYGVRFGKKIPWVREFPFGVIRDPQYVGSMMSLVGCLPWVSYPYIALWLLGYAFMIKGSYLLMLILQPYFTALPSPLFRRAKLPPYSPPATRLTTQTLHSQLEPNGFGGGDDDAIDVSWAGGAFGEDKDYDKDPEFADILGSCIDDPDKAKSKMEERLRKKRNKILHTKTGSANPMKVYFNKFDFSNSYIWLEFYNAPLEQDISLISDTIRSWHIVGRLGGCNSMNMQLSQAPLDIRPSYNAIQGANVTPTAFYNIGDLEAQHNLARIWVDIGTVEPLLLDILINALTQISSDYVGIKQVMFGGSEFEGWEENLKSEDVGYSVHKI